VSGYTHCRGCGQPLADDYDNPERDDGLCLTLGSKNLDCTERFGRWWQATHPEEKKNFAEATRGKDSWKSPLWSVKVDEWLAATR
jgi:hypothetical protein